jgi:hypothetical protein
MTDTIEWYHSFANDYIPEKHKDEKMIEKMICKDDPK